MSSKNSKIILKGYASFINSLYLKGVTEGVEHKLSTSWFDKTATLLDIMNLYKGFEKELVSKKIVLTLQVSKCKKYDLIQVKKSVKVEKNPISNVIIKL